MVNRDEGWIVTFLDERGSEKHEAWETSPPRREIINPRKEDEG